MAKISGVAVDFIASPRIITIPDTITEVTIQDLHDTIRDIEDDIHNGLQYQKLVSSAGKEDLGGGTLVGITMTLQNAKLAFAERSGPTFVQCKVAGGNLVAVDVNGDTIDPIQTTDFTQVITTASSSTTIIETNTSGLTDQESKELSTTLKRGEWLALK